MLLITSPLLILSHRLLYDSRIFLLSFFTWYSQFPLSTFRSLTFIPDFSFMYPTFRLHLWHLYSCWYGGNSSAWSLRITTVSGMFPVISFPCISYRTEDYHCVSVISIWLTPVLENLCIRVAPSQCCPHNVHWKLGSGTLLTRLWAVVCEVSNFLAVIALPSFRSCLL